MDENQIEDFKELRDCVVAKFPIVDFGGGPQSKKLTDLYHDVKMLVFCSEPWKLLGAHVTFCTLIIIRRSLSMRKSNTHWSSARIQHQAMKSHGLNI